MVLMRKRKAVQMFCSGLIEQVSQSARLQCRHRPRAETTTTNFVPRKALLFNQKNLQAGSRELTRRECTCWARAHDGGIPDSVNGACGGNRSGKGHGFSQHNIMRAGKCVHIEKFFNPAVSARAASSAAVKAFFMESTASACTIGERDRSRLPIRTST